MIPYEIGSPVRNENPSGRPRQFFFVTTGTGTSETDSIESDQNAQRWSWFHRQPVKSGAAAALLWQAAVEPSFGAAPKWETPVRHTFNVQIVGTVGTEPPQAVDEVKRAADVVTSWERSGNGQLASFYAVYFVEQSFRLRAYEQVNRLLSEIDVALLTEWSMIALLRSSFSARTVLPAWSQLLASVHRKLESQGKDTKKLLRGLNR